jgi:hypothetical protein
MTEMIPSTENKDALAETLAQMRLTLAAAPLLAMYTAARIAIQVRTDSDTILRQLEKANAAFVGEASDDDLGTEGLLLTLKISGWLATRGDERRTAERRRDDFRARAERAERMLGANHSEVRNFWEQYYLELGRVADRSDEAIANYRASLEARGWPRRMDFRLSLSSQNLATMLRRSTNPEEVTEGERITAFNARWRTKQYGARHPFTMVAEGNRIVDELFHLERAHDEGTLTQDLVALARATLEDAERLTAARKSVLGVHHGGTVKAMMYQARAQRLLGHTDAARAIAQEALAYYLTYSSKKDETVTPQLRLIIAEGYAAEADAADANERVASAAGSGLVADDERDRARSLRKTASDALDASVADFVRWDDQEAWLPRIEAVRARIAE